MKQQNGLQKKGDILDLFDFLTNIIHDPNVWIR